MKKHVYTFKNCNQVIECDFMEMPKEKYVLDMTVPNMMLQMTSNGWKLIKHTIDGKEQYKTNQPNKIKQVKWAEHIMQNWEVVEFINRYNFQPGKFFIIPVPLSNKVRLIYEV